MKEFYQKLLYIPKNGKVPEKVMLVRIGISIFFILLCMAAMSLSAYAFFSSTVTSSGSVIRSAEYTLDVISSDFTEDSGVYLLDNTAGNTVKSFHFQITAQNSTATFGYAKITVMAEGKEDQIFYSNPIWSGNAAGEEKPYERSYSIDVAAGSSVTMTVSAGWGSCSQEMSEDGALIDLSSSTPSAVGVDGAQEDPSAEPDSQQPATDHIQPDQSESENATEQTEQPAQGTDSSDDVQTSDTDSEQQPEEDAVTEQNQTTDSTENPVTE